MPSYKAPLREHLFCLYDLFDFEAHRQLPGFEDFSRDVIEQVLEQSGRFASEIALPLNRSGDEEGARLVNGSVVTPKGFRDAYRILCEGGWPALTCDPADGGQGMPHMINVLFEEMLCGANMSLALFPGLTRGAYVALKHYGAPDQKAKYLARLASGEWAGAMCLTEAHCGTDLGLLRTQAAPRGDHFAITGTKVFISAGDHDLTPNIIYLVLARLPDAPKGTKGISLFVVPKILDDGARNRLGCSALERKMGIHGSPTCVMNFDGATGWLVGEPHQGLRAMFAMMNTERIAVGTQGLATAETSYQNAVAYARERRQGRGSSSTADADPIIMHADVRRMLMTQRVLTEGCRMLALATAAELDAAERHPDPQTRKLMEARVAFMTPVVKAFLTDCGSEATNLGMQVLGGHGYVRDNGQEQLVRDVRVTQIYEGTNGVQALDFVGRKILGDGGRVLEEAINRTERDANCSNNEAMSLALAKLKSAARHVLGSGNAPDEAGAAATDFLHLFALTEIGRHWLRVVETARTRPDDAFHRAKLATAHFYFARILPRTEALHAAITSGADSVMAMERDWF